MSDMSNNLLACEGDKLKAWTDHPFEILGDVLGRKAPVRYIDVLSYDGDKYCRIRVCGFDEEIKTGYIYQRAGRFGDVQPIAISRLLLLPATT